MIYPIHNQSIQLITQSIIIADNDSDDQFFFKEALSHINPSFRLEVANDGAELFQLLQDQVPYLIFLDFHLPGKNALQCLKEIKRNPMFQQVPVIILSSIKQPEEMEAAYQLGADLFYVKPFAFTDLKIALKAFLDHDWKIRGN